MGMGELVFGELRAFVHGSHASGHIGVTVSCKIMVICLIADVVIEVAVHSISFVCVVIVFEVCEEI
jgi:hypothetical protein